MTQEGNPTTPSNHPLSYGRPMLLGAAVGLAVISFFIFGVDTPKPEWGKFWMIKPLIITPLAGAGGGLFFAIMDYLSTTRSFPKALAIIISLIGFVVALWLGIVLGLNGTMWD